MIEKMAKRIVSQMEIQKIINKANCEYYEYAIIGMAEHIITVGTMLFLGVIFREFLPTVCFNNSIMTKTWERPPQLTPTRCSTKNTWGFSLKY